MYRLRPGAGTWRSHLEGGEDTVVCRFARIGDLVAPVHRLLPGPAMKRTWLEIACAAMVANLLACGGGAGGGNGGEDSAGADGGAGGGGGVADGGGDADCPASEPICGAFENSGSQGGYVEVSLTDGDDAAIVRTSSLPDYPVNAGNSPNDAVPQELEFHVPLAPTAGPSE